MITNNYIDSLISRARPAIINTLTTTMMMISFKATSMVLFSLITLFVFDAYAQQQGGSANSGDATGGAANAEGIRGFTCNYCRSLIPPRLQVDKLLVEQRQVEQRPLKKLIVFPHWSIKAIPFINKRIMQKLYNIMIKF